MVGLDFFNIKCKILEIFVNKNKTDFKRQQFLNKIIMKMPNLDLSDIIEYTNSNFENISRRQSDLITSEDTLLDLLEKRDLIDRIELERKRPLTTLKIKQAIDRYNPPTANLQNIYTIEREKYEEQMKLNLARTHVTVLNKNVCRGFISNNPNQIHQTQQQCNVNCNFNNNTTPTLFEERKAWIYKEISVEIGKKWRDFGRGIEMREGEMDDLEITCKGIEERIYKMLHKLETNEFGNMERIYYKIIKSLDENCNRRKLSDKIKKSMIR